MAKFVVGQTIIHEGRKCRISELTDHKAKLINLTPKDSSDWTVLEVLLIDIKEDKKCHLQTSLNR